MRKTPFDNIRSIKESGATRNDIIFDIPFAQTEDGDIGIMFRAFNNGGWGFRCEYHGPGDGLMMDLFWRLAEEAGIQERTIEYVQSLPRSGTRDVVFHGNRITANGFSSAEIIGLACKVLLPCFSHVYEEFRKHGDELPCDELRNTILEERGGWGNLPKALLGDWCGTSFGGGNCL